MIETLYGCLGQTQPPRLLNSPGYLLAHEHAPTLRSQDAAKGIPRISPLVGHHEELAADLARRQAFDGLRQLRKWNVVRMQ